MRGEFTARELIETLSEGADETTGTSEVSLTAGFKSIKTKQCIQICRE